MNPNPRTYRAKAVEYGLGTTAGGKEQLAVRFEVQDPETPGQSFTWYAYFTDAALERTIESLRHCGWTGDDLSDLSGIERNEVSIVVEDEEYEGKVRAKVRWVNALGGLALKSRMEGGQAKAFAASLKDRIRGLGVGKPAAAKPSSPAASGGDDTWRHPGAKAPPPEDVPF